MKFSIDKTEKQCYTPKCIEYILQTYEEEE